MEDHEDTLDLLGELLAAKGFDSLSAFTIAAALDHLASCEEDTLPDVVLLDGLLADGDALDYWRAITIVPEWRRIPIIVMTGYPPLVPRAQGAGVFAKVVLKPFHIADILAAVDELGAERRRARRG